MRVFAAAVVVFLAHVPVAHVPTALVSVARAVSGSMGGVTAEVGGIVSTTLLVRDTAPRSQNPSLVVGQAEVEFDIFVPRVSRVGVAGKIDKHERGEVYGYVDGPYGLLKVGAGEDVAETLHYTAPAVGVNGVDDPNFYPLTRASARLQTVEALTGVKNKISYITPRLFGLKVGASYTPRAGTPRGRVASVSVNFLESFSIKTVGTVHMGFSASFMGGHAYVGKNPVVWKLGANVAWQGVVLGGAYYEEENVSTQKVWTLGITTDVGPWTVGTAYRESRRAAAKNSVWQIGAVYHWTRNWQWGVYTQFARDANPPMATVKGWEMGMSATFLF